MNNNTIIFKSFLLKDFQKDCEKNERYIEAGQAEEKMKEVKKEIAKQKKNNFKNNQTEQVL